MELSSFPNHCLVIQKTTMGHCVSRSQTQRVTQPAHISIRNERLVPLARTLQEMKKADTTPRLQISFSRMYQRRRASRKHMSAKETMSSEGLKPLDLTA